MKFETKKAIIIILFVISLIINVINIRSTYAKYQELVDTDYKVGIRKWFVVVNAKDIQNNETLLTETVQPNLIANEHMKENVLVPGREGYFEIDLDYTRVDVPFTYSFEVYQIGEEANKLSDFEFYGYSILEEASGFEIDSVENSITYIGLEEGETTETIDPETGEKTVQFIQEMVDPETGAQKNKILTATLKNPEENAINTAETDESGRTQANSEETNTFKEVGKIAQVTEKVINATNGLEVEEEKILFRLAQELDIETNTTRFSVIQTQDPTKLESFERYQNLAVYFKWNDDEENNLDNLADTQFRGVANPDTNVANTLLKYQGKLEFKQYVKERVGVEELNITTP